MIRHEDISGTEQTFAGGGVQEQFAEMGVERGVQPARGAWFQSDRPQHGGKPLMMLRRKPGQMMPDWLWREGNRFHRFFRTAA